MTETLPVFNISCVWDKVHSWMYAVVRQSCQGIVFLIYWPQSGTATLELYPRCWRQRTWFLRPAVFQYNIMATTTHSTSASFFKSWNVYLPLLSAFQPSSGCSQILGAAQEESRTRSPALQLYQPETRTSLLKGNHTNVQIQSLKLKW